MVAIIMTERRRIDNEDLEEQKFVIGEGKASP